MADYLPEYVWHILADLLDHEDTHDKGEHCVHAIVNRLPSDVHNTARGFQNARRIGLVDASQRSAERTWSPAPWPAASEVEGG